MSKRPKHRTPRKDFFPIFFFAFVIVVLLATYQSLAIKPLLIVTGIILLIAIIFFVSSLMRRYARRREVEDNRLQIKLVEHLQDIDPIQFERFVGQIFEREGYHIEFTPKTGDHGIDILLKRNGEVAAVQVKRYGLKKSVPESDVRDLTGSMHNLGIKKGVFVTSAHFSTPARVWTKKLLQNGEMEIALIDGDDFVKKVRVLAPASWREIIMSKALEN